MVLGGVVPEVSHEECPPSVRVPLSMLREGPKIRRGGVNYDHLGALVALRGAWPPVLLRRHDYAVIDGHYRCMAAERLGFADVEAVFFDGDDSDEDACWVEALHRNASQGLPLTLDERREAARHLLQRRPQLSNRWLAQLCALSPATVGRLRRTAGSTGQSEQLDKRQGRDGRSRPVDAWAARERVAEALAADPEASLREIASRVNSSKGTVRAVRRSLQAGAIGDSPRL